MSGPDDGTVTYMGTLLAVDGTNLAHRAHHALSNTRLRNNSGADAWVIHGVVGMLARAIETVSATSMLFALDSPGGCPQRRQWAPDYKAGRAPQDPELVRQLQAIGDQLTSAGIAVATADGWEADDIIASVATTAEGRGASVAILSSDKDLHQVIGEQCVVLKPEGHIVDEKALMAKYGVGGSRWVEYAALIGERADNLPGVSGIGPKRAAGLIAAVDDVEDAIARPQLAAQAVGKGPAKSLVAGAGIFRRNRQVGTLRRDLPVDISGLRLDRLDLGQTSEVLGQVGTPQSAAKLARAIRR